MRVLFTSLRNISHFQPLVPFIETCRRQGHEVAVAAPADLAERVASTGAAFFPVGHPGDAALQPIWARVCELPPVESNRAVVSEIFAGVCAQAALPKLTEAMSRFRPSVVVRESQEYAAVIASAKLGVPHVRVAITLRSSELAMLSAAAPSVDAHAKRLGLAPDPTGERVLGETAFTLFPASLEAPHFRSPRVRRFRTAKKDPAPLPEWWGARQEPLVYVTLGTVIGTSEAMRSAYRVALDAVSDLPLRVLLTTGAELPSEVLGKIPDNVHVERFVPQEDVLPHAAAVVCHGGSGTTLGALSAGVPLVLTPMFADQPDNAARVAELGAGVALPLGNESASELRQALSRVLDDASFRTAAMQLSAEMAELPQVDEAALELERFA